LTVKLHSRYAKGSRIGAGVGHFGKVGVGVGHFTSVSSTLVYTVIKYHSLHFCDNGNNQKL